MRLFYYLLFVFLSLLVSCAPLGTEEQDFHTLGGQGLNKEYELIYISLNEIERTPIQSVQIGPEETELRLIAYYPANRKRDCLKDIIDTTQLLPDNHFIFSRNKYLDQETEYIIKIATNTSKEPILAGFSVKDANNTQAYAHFTIYQCAN